MASRQKTFLFGGLVAGTAAVAGAFYLFNKNKEGKPENQPKEVPKEKVIAILKEIQREMFAIFTNISMIANQLKDSYRGKIQNQEIREYLLNMNPHTKNQIQQISDTVCKKHGVEEKDLKHACEVTFAEDKEIRVLLNEAKTSFDKAFLGKAPDLRCEIPAFLTPELTLQIMTKIMKETNLKIFRFLQELKSKNVSISYNDPEVFMGLQDLKLDDIKLKVVIEEGLDKFEDSPLKIFQFAAQKYTSEDANQYAKKFMKLEMQNSKAMDAVMKGAPDAELMIEAIGSHLVNNEEDLTISTQYKKTLAQEKKENGDQEDSEDEELKALGQIKELRQQVSFKLKSTLEDSSFPQELVDSAVNTLFNVFDKLEKTPVSALKKSGKNTPKNTSQLFESEEVKESSTEVVANGQVEEPVVSTQVENKEEEKSVEVENKEEENQIQAENKEAEGEVQAETEEKVPVATEEVAEEVKVHTDVDENKEGENVNQEVAENNEEGAQNE